MRFAVQTLQDGLQGGRQDALFLSSPRSGCPPTEQAPSLGCCCFPLTAASQPGAVLRKTPLLVISGQADPLNLIQGTR